MADRSRPGVLVVPFRIGSAMPDLRVAGEPEVLSPPLPEGTPQERLGVLCRAIADRTAAGDVRAVYIGDCVLTLGVLAGLQRRGIDPTVIWFDAHGDFHTWETTRSGFLGGMPLAMAVGRGEQAIVRAAGLTPIAEDRVVLVDGRDLDPGEAVVSSRLRHVSMDQLQAMPIPPGPLFVHLDIDVVDPVEVPAVNYSAPGGPSVRRVRDAIARLAATGQVEAFSLNVWEPVDPAADRSAAAAELFVAAVLRSSGRP